MGPDHISRLELGENGRPFDDQLPNEDLFRIEVVPNYLEHIATFLASGQCREEYTTIQRKHLVFRATDYQITTCQLYNMGLDQVLRRCVLDHERPYILWECHNRVVGGHVGGNSTTRKILQVGLWWPTVHKDVKEYVKKCDICQRTSKPSHKDELPL